MNKNIFNMPKSVTISQRTSSITNSFYNGIVPAIQPTEEQIKEALRILEQNENNVCCVYCGRPKTEWDHLHPLIMNKKHTGYITEIANLVPACNKCNESKGNKEWKQWILSDAKQSPKTLGIKDLNHRIELIQKYDDYFNKTIIDLEKDTDPKLWAEYVDAYNTIIKNIENAQSIMNKIKENQKKILNPQKKSKVISNNNSNKVEDYLRSIGKTTFVKYFNLFYDEQLSATDIIPVMEAKEDYENSSYKTKCNAGKRIVKEGLAKAALENVSISDKVSNKIRQQALDLIEDYF